VRLVLLAAPGFTWAVGARVFACPLAFLFLSLFLISRISEKVKIESQWSQSVPVPGFQKRKKTVSVAVRQASPEGVFIESPDKARLNQPPPVS
jgi:hypothetical protein